MEKIQFDYFIKLNSAAGAISFNSNSNLLAIAELNGQVSLHRKDGKLLKKLQRNRFKFGLLLFIPMVKH